MSLRKNLIKLAHGNPELRPHLLPLLKQAADWEQADQEFQRIAAIIKHNYSGTPSFDLEHRKTFSMRVAIGYGQRGMFSTTSYRQFAEPRELFSYDLPEKVLRAIHPAAVVFKSLPNREIKRLKIDTRDKDGNEVNLTVM
jgi:hypothetical protein